MLTEAEIAAAREQAFQDQQYRCHYTVDRGLFVTEFEEEYSPEKLPGYNNLVPSVDGLTLADVLYQSGQKTPKAEILDVGCGSGVYLVDANKGYGLTAHGITACYYPLRDHPTLGTKTLEELSEMNIHIQEGNAEDLIKIYGRERFDVVTAVHSMRYMADPWGVFRQMYDVVKSGGYGFLHFFPDCLRVSGQRDHLIEDLRGRCMVVREGVRSFTRDEYFWDIGFKKEQEVLDLELIPVEIILAEYNSQDDYVKQFRYSYQRRGKRKK